MHGLDWYDYHARQYDGIVNQFWSMDPLCEKYYHISPYVYCAGNPVNYIDPDGRDAVSIIDEENKTITIRANYYVETGNRPSNITITGANSCKGYSTADIETMNQYSQQLNDLNLIVSLGDYKGFSIKFDLTFIDGGSELDIDTKFSNGDIETYEGINISNRIARWDETFRKFNPDSDGKVTGGVTDGTNYIVMNKSYDTKLNRWHEIFHTFGFEDAQNPYKTHGIMRYGPENPNKNDANNLINNEFMRNRRVKK